MEAKIEDGKLIIEIDLQETFLTDDEERRNRMKDRSQTNKETKQSKSKGTEATRQFTTPAK